jgi:single-strand DNA-binding protein
MSKGTLNKVMLIGNLGKDPEIRYTSSGLAFANISIATTETKKNKDTNENTDTTTWHKIVAIGKLAEIMGEYLKKGSKIYIEGKIQHKSWEDKNTKETKYMTEVLAENMQMLSYNGKTENKNDPYQNLDSKTKENQGQIDTEWAEDVPF